jgi:hypothetical protein
MMNIQTFSLINIVFGSLSLTLSGSSFIIAIIYYKKTQMKFMLLFAGMLLAFFINGFGNFTGLLQIFIFPSNTVH